MESAMRTQAEEDQAWGAVQKARAKAKNVYTSTQLAPNLLSISKPERIQRLHEANHKLVAAQVWLKSANKRGDLITEFVRSTFGFASAKEDAARHRVLLSWILAQFPLIEAELSPTGAIETGSDGAKGTKRSFHSNDDGSPQRTPKKRKLGRSEFTFHSDQNTAILTAEEIQQQVSLVANENETRRLQAREAPAKHSPRAVTIQEAAPQGLRRSARITARLKTPGKATALQTFHCPRGCPSPIGRHG